MDSDDELDNAARAARANAHAPYSGFCVGAALRTASGRIFAGANGENAAYPEGWCAETAALATMVTAGERDLLAISLAGPHGIRLAPCGGCRQRLAEFAGPDLIVRLPDGAGGQVVTTLGALLPGPFALAARPKTDDHPDK